MTQNIWSTTKKLASGARLIRVYMEGDGCDVIIGYYVAKKYRGAMWLGHVRGERHPIFQGTLQDIAGMACERERAGRVTP